MNQIITVVEGEQSDVVTNVNENLKFISNNIFPNPSDGSFSINSQFLHVTHQFSLTDLRGRLIHRFDFPRPIKSSGYINFMLPSSIPNGTYIFTDGQNFQELLLIKR